jgi:hypothetical protein
MYYKIGFFLIIILACAIGYQFSGDKATIIDYFYAIGIIFFFSLAAVGLIFAFIINPMRILINKNKKGGQ